MYSATNDHLATLVLVIIALLMSVCWNYVRTMDYMEREIAKKYGTVEGRRRYVYFWFFYVGLAMVGVRFED